MDSLTQIVLGAAVGEATLGKKVGNKALLYGGIAGTIPDLDVFFGAFTDTITAIEWHRGFSHSLLFFLLLSPILGYLVNKIERKSNLGWKLWTKLFFFGLFTHALLDCFTTWGTQLFWPLGNKIALNSIFVIDPLYTLPFLICTIMVLFYKRDSEKRYRINRFGLMVSTCYLLSAFTIKSMADNQFREVIQDQNIAYSDMSSRPSPMNTILWNVNIDTKDAYLIGDYSFFDTQPIQFKSYPKQREISKEIEHFPNVQRMIAISEGWYIIERKGGKWYFNDLRFGLTPKKDGGSSFVFSYELEEIEGQIFATEVPKTRSDGQFLLENLWKRIKGN